MSDKPGMTDIAFHFNVADKAGYSCRLVRKAWAAGHRVLVLGPPALLQEVDRLLWVAAPTEFIPHCWGSASPELLQATPVVLQADLVSLPHQDVLVSLHPEVIEGYASFKRHFEVVSLDAQDRQEARLRWRHYQQAGCKLIQHDLGAAKPE